MHPLIETHRTAMRDLATRRGIRDVKVFGSMARGDADADSDVDLLVVLPPGSSCLALGVPLMDIEELVHRRVDIVTEASLHPMLRDKVLLEAQPL